MWEENPNLAHFAHSAFTDMAKHMDEESYDHANMTGRMVYLIIYNAIQQQMICNELQ